MSAHIRKQKLESIDTWQDLFWQLQERPDTPESKRIERILELFASIGTAVTGKGAALNSLRIALSRYQWVTFVALTPIGYCVIRRPANREFLSKAEAWEYEAFSLLLHVVPSIGERPRIRRCAECQEWFYAEARDDQKFCKRANCRQAHHQKDPKTHAKKLEAMRRRYATEKKRNRESKASVGFTETPKRKSRTR
jgi:hypothetical protein